MSRNDDVEVTVTVLRETDSALLVRDGLSEEWLPKSQIRDRTKLKGDAEELTIPEWLALQKGLI